MARNISTADTKRLLLESGGICAFPGCNRRLVGHDSEYDSGAVIAELAHIVADSREGPRGNVPLSEEERSRHDNLIVVGILRRSENIRTHVPSPLQITDHVGDTARSQLIRELLVLTKMNWNSANFSGLFQITLRFSKLVGDILREVPEDQEPQPKYKYYM